MFLVTVLALGQSGCVTMRLVEPVDGNSLPCMGAVVDAWADWC